jgi:hypothetical protein
MSPAAFLGHPAPKEILVGKWAAAVGGTTAVRGTAS